MEEEFRRALAEQNAESQTFTLRAEPGTQLNPNKTTRNLAKIALSNGRVEGHGRDPEVGPPKDSDYRGNADSSRRRLESRYRVIFFNIYPEERLRLPLQ